MTYAPFNPIPTGTRFSRLVVLDSERIRIGAKKYLACQCDCGKSVNVTPHRLRNGSTKSCGCMKREIMATHRLSHGQSQTQVYQAWFAMLRRCRDSKHKNYPDYGGRGIQVCERWNDFATFIADMGPRPHLHTVERIDNDGNYEPSNCRWASRREQAQNTRRVIRARSRAVEAGR